MRKLRRAGLAALVLGVAVSAAAAQKPAEPSSWWPSFWGDAKPKAKADGQKEAPRVNRAAAYARLERDWERRKEVCDRLREIALETNDTKLEEEAARLDEAAWKIYQDRSQRLLSDGVIDEPKAGGAVIDETRDMLLDDAKRKREGRR
jgi:hypothetical protein